MTEILAYHNDADTKAKYLARVQAHAEADRLIQGTGWKDGKGCAVGCTLESYDHSRYPVELGVPEHIAHLEDAIFEGLNREDAMAWPAAFLDAIPVGADLSMVWPRFALWMLSGESSPMYEPAQHDTVRDAVAGVAALYREWVETGSKPDDERFARAARDARDAWAASAARAARAARAAWAARAARDARDARDARAARAARDARDARDARAAWAAPWSTMRDKLLELLRDAPVGGSDE